MNRFIPIICGLFLATTATAFENLEQCKSEYRVWRSGETLPANVTNQICHCAAARAKDAPIITTKELLLCQWKVLKLHPKEPSSTHPQGAI